ncbi:DUF6585 family protein [Limnoglobus roseus]|uniref:Uncharacterized protein n=1 Tax=Limnoglobus roseus TaxID=2598579 RepID=A0A5C1APC6_9BACT|nr:DUF6585 family protein [Limnoglobus roseus]QEL21021.1 hypothetical protein PX52LOC_08150 [Limnoglobus roseus]
MGLTDADEQPDALDEEVDLATKELGTPDAVFRAGGRWARVKAIVGILLILYGVVANYVWWVHGPAQFNHLQFHILFWPPIIGTALLWFLYRNRGLRVLVFPTGLLRLRPDEVESFPWETIAVVRQKTDANEPEYRWGVNGQLTACWLPVSVPAVQVWNAWFEIERADGTKTRFTPAVADYTDLAERVQRGTFSVLWPKLLADLGRGKSVAFGDLFVTPEGLRQGDRTLSWAEIKEVSLVHKILTIKRKNTWRTWLVKDSSQVPNLHVLLGILTVLGPKKVEEEPEEEAMAE